MGDSLKSKTLHALSWSLPESIGLQGVRFVIGIVLARLLFPKELGMSRDALYEKLKEYNVFSRRYFYPLITDYACYRSVSIKDALTAARRVSEGILTLPIYDSLELSDVEKISEIISALPSEK